MDNNDKQFTNRKPREVNLLRWFVIGIIVGLVIDVIVWIEDGWDGALFIVCPIIFGFAFIALRKWLFRTFWL